MAGKIQPLEPVFKGESKTLKFTVTDDQGQSVIDGQVVTGQRIDIGGATIEFQVNYPPGAPYMAAISKTVGAGITIKDQTDPATKGDLEVLLVPGDTKDLPAKLYKYDLWVTVGGYRRCVVAPSDFPLREPVNDAP